MRRLTFLPFDEYDIHDNCVDCFMVEGVLTRDFGNSYKGETAILSFDFVKGEVVCWTIEGEEMWRKRLFVTI